jgi:hypothetical protein
LKILQLAGLLRLLELRVDLGDGGDRALDGVAMVGDAGVDAQKKLSDKDGSRSVSSSEPPSAPPEPPSAPQKIAEPRRSAEDRKRRRSGALRVAPESIHLAHSSKPVARCRVTQQGPHAGQPNGNDSHITHRLMLPDTFVWLIVWAVFLGHTMNAIAFFLAALTSGLVLLAYAISIHKEIIRHKLPQGWLLDVGSITLGLSALATFCLWMWF